MRALPEDNPKLPIFIGIFFPVTILHGILIPRNYGPWSDFTGKCIPCGLNSYQDIFIGNVIPCGLNSHKDIVYCYKWTLDYLYSKY
jgi:hypothetical protein